MPDYLSAAVIYLARRVERLASRAHAGLNWLARQSLAVRLLAVLVMAAIALLPLGGVPLLQWLLSLGIALALVIPLGFIAVAIVVNLFGRLLR